MNPNHFVSYLTTRPVKWTPEMDATIATLAQRGLCARQIAYALSTSQRITKGAVIGRAMRKGIPLKHTTAQYRPASTIPSDRVPPPITLPVVRFLARQCG